MTTYACYMCGDFVNVVGSKKGWRVFIDGDGPPVTDVGVCQSCAKNVDNFIREQNYMIYKFVHKHKLGAQMRTV